MVKGGFFYFILRNSRLKFLDYLIILFAISLIAVSSLYVYGDESGNLYVHIKSVSREWLLPLGKEKRIVNVKGPLGITEVEIDRTSVRIIKSPCRNKICIRSGSISKPGQWIACLPNRVIVSIGGKESRGTKGYVDAVNF